MVNEIKGRKVGEYNLVLNERILESILMRGLLPRAKVKQMIETGEILQLTLTDASNPITPRNYIEDANLLVDSYRPEGVAHPRTDSIFAFVYRGKITPLTDCNEHSRSTILINGLTGKELVGDGCFIDAVVGNLIASTEGYKHPVHGMIRFTQEKARKNIEEAAKNYWSSFVTLDDFIENYHAKGLDWDMGYDQWMKITDKKNLPSFIGYPEIIIPSKVEPSRLEIATKYIHKS